MRPYLENKTKGQFLWLTSILPATQLRLGFSWFRASLGKKVMQTPHLNQEAKHGGIGLSLQLFGRMFIRE
jgi:hypothetical protein